MYPDSLGIMASAWYGNGGGHDYSPKHQITVAQKLIASMAKYGAVVQGTRVYVGFVPDQRYGLHNGSWNFCDGAW